MEDMNLLVGMSAVRTGSSLTLSQVMSSLRLSAAKLMVGVCLSRQSLSPNSGSPLNSLTSLIIFKVKK